MREISICFSFRKSYGIKKKKKNSIWADRHNMVSHNITGLSCFRTMCTFLLSMQSPKPGRFLNGCINKCLYKLRWWRYGKGSIVWKKREVGITTRSRFASSTSPYVSDIGFSAAPCGVLRAFRRIQPGDTFKDANSGLKTGCSSNAEQRIRWADRVFLRVLGFELNSQLSDNYPGSNHREMLVRNDRKSRPIFLLFIYFF